MVTIKSKTDENGTSVPETQAPNFGFGSHFDGVNFYYFENKEEADNFYKNL